MDTAASQKKKKKGDQLLPPIWRVENERWPGDAHEGGKRISFRHSVECERHTGQSWENIPSNGRVGGRSGWCKQMGWLFWILFMPSLFPFPKQRSEAAKGTEWKMFLNLLNEELGFIPPHYHLPCFGFGFLVLNSRKTYTHTHTQANPVGRKN